MSDAVYLTSLFILFGTIFAIFAMKYGAAAIQARARASNDAAHRDLAEKAATAQSEGATALSFIRTEVAEISARLTAVEKILRDVG